MPITVQDNFVYFLVLHPVVISARYPTGKAKELQCTSSSAVVVQKADPT